MKVIFNLDSGASITSCKSITFDLNTEKGRVSLGFTEEEWMSLKDEEKQKECEKWAYNNVEIYYEEI